MAELLDNPAVYRFLALDLPTPYTVEHARSFIESCGNADDMMVYAIECGGEAVGTISARLRGRTARIGYWPGETYWRQGIMTQALPRLLDMLPDRITQVEATVFDANEASRALLRRCGFSQQPGESLSPSPSDQPQPPLLYTRPR